MVVLVLVVSIFYYRIAIGFGEATVQTTIAIDRAYSDLITNDSLEYKRLMEELQEAVPFDTTQ